LCSVPNERAEDITFFTVFIQTKKKERGEGVRAEDEAEEREA
jgi:hypothetical protein